MGTGGKMKQLTLADIQKAYEQKDEPVTGDMVRAGFQGLSLGFGDEIEAFVRSTYKGVPYKVERDRIRSEIDSFRNEHPIMAYGAEIAGGALTGGAGAGRALGSAALRNVPRLAALAGVGAVEGGILGAGEAKEVENLPGSVAKGMAFGAGFGAGGRLVEKGGSAIAGRFPAEQWKRPLKKIIDQAGGKERVTREVASSPGSFIADATPETRAYAAYIARQPGGREISQRAVSARQRNMNTDIQSAANRLGSDDFYTKLDDIIQTKKTDANKLYGSAYKISVNPAEIPESLLLDPDVINTVKKTVSVYNRVAKKDLKLPAFKEENAIAWVDAVKKIDDLQFWDEWQKVTRGHVKGTAKDNAYLAGQIDEQVRKPIVELFDNQTGGAFKDARAAYRKSSNLEDALIDGRNIFKPSQDPEEIIRKAANMSADEKSVFLTGALRELKKIAGDKPSTANSAWAIVRSPNFRQKIRAVIGDEEKASAFLASMDNLTKQSATFNAVAQGRQSITSDMLFQDSAAKRSMVDVAGDVMRGDIGGAASGVLGTLKSGPTGLTQQGATNTANMLFSPNTNILDSLYKRGNVSPYIAPGLLGGALQVPNYEQ